MLERRRVASPPSRPVLIFDGDCDFCRFWVARWRHRTGERVEYVPYQSDDVLRRFPEVSREACARAVQLIESDGCVYEAAEAVCRLLTAAGLRAPLFAYAHVPGFAATGEAAYRTIADHRPLASRVSTLLWGDVTEPSTYARATWLFLRLLGVVYLVAFGSLAAQVLGLVGHDGILPARLSMDAARTFAAAEHIGADRFRLLPTLCWISTSDMFLRALCLVGAALAVLLVAGLAPIVVLPALWLLYLSLSVVCREFLSYQWDTLLLETGLLAVFVAPAARRDRPGEAVDPPLLTRWLMWWLLFRLMVGSGGVKLASGDPTWRNLTALTFHYETQPIPTPLAWYASQLPVWFQTMSTLVVFVVELLVPWFILGPRRLRTLAFAFFAGLQMLIALTGNYAFFNLLAVSLCVFLLDDATLSHLGRGFRLRARLPPPLELRRSPNATPSRVRHGATIAFAIVTVPVSALMLTGSVGLALPGAPLIAPLAEFVTPFRSVNSYGLFAVMTTQRDEIVVEGSDDGVSWRAYEFNDKPGEIDRRPPWVAPHQPRLDWQMWFAALDVYGDAPWFRNFCLRLLDGSPDVIRLLARDPFAGRPPRYVRTVRYRYHFTHASSTRGPVSEPTTTARGQVAVPTAAETCPRCWWTRERIGEFSPVLARP